MAALLEMPGACAAIELSSPIVGTPLAAAVALSGSGSKNPGLCGAVSALLSAGARVKHPSVAGMAPLHLLSHVLFAGNATGALPALGGVLARLVDAGAARVSPAAKAAFALLAVVANQPELFGSIEAAAPGDAQTLRVALLRPATARLSPDFWQFSLIAAAACGAERGLEALRARGALSAARVNALVTRYAHDDHFRTTNAVVVAAIGGHASTLRLLLSCGGTPDGVRASGSNSGHHVMAGVGASSLGAPLANAVWGARRGCCDGRFADCVDVLLGGGAAVSHLTAQPLVFLRRGSFERLGRRLQAPEPDGVGTPDAARVVRALTHALLLKPGVAVTKKVRTCSNCAFCSVSAADAPLSACGRCRSVSYCGRACQTAHWAATHKATCVPVAPASVASAASPAKLLELLPPLLLASISYGDFEMARALCAAIAELPSQISSATAPVGAAHSVAEPASTSASPWPSPWPAPDDVIAAALSAAEPAAALDFVLSSEVDATPLAPARRAGSALGPGILVACVGGKAEFQRWTGSTEVTVHPIPCGSDGCVRPEVLASLRRLLASGWSLSIAGVAELDFAVFDRPDPRFLALLGDLGALSPAALNAMTSHLSGTALTRCKNRAQWDATPDAHARRAEAVALLVAAGATEPGPSKEEEAEKRQRQQWARSNLKGSCPFHHVPAPHHDASEASEALEGAGGDY